MASNVTANRGYQLPDAANKLKDDVLRLVAALTSIDADVAGVLLALADKSNVGHVHAMEAITGLVDALAGKLNVGSHDALANLTDVDVTGASNGMALLHQAGQWIPVALQINNVAGLEASLNGKATQANITAAINALVAAAPGALDTLNELAAALGDDPNFAATMTSALAGKLAKDGGNIGNTSDQAAFRAAVGALGIPQMSGTYDGNLDNLTDPGWVPQLVRGTGTNGWGDGSYCHLLVIAYSSNLCQFGFPYNASSKVRFRVRSGSTWGDWQYLPTMAEISTLLASKADASLLAAKADVAHNHSAANITSGVLPVERGGSGQSSEAGMRGVYTGSAANNLDYPVGTMLLVRPHTGADPLRNEAASIGYDNAISTSSFFLRYGAGLSGTWRCRGAISGSPTNTSAPTAFLMQRTV